MLKNWYAMKPRTTRMANLLRIKALNAFRPMMATKMGRRALSFSLSRSKRGKRSFFFRRRPRAEMKYVVLTFRQGFCLPSGCDSSAVTSMPLFGLYTTSLAPKIISGNLYLSSCVLNTRAILLKIAASIF